MAYLTRIKNNQITDSTILANTKILPGSIVGSLFNAELTLSSNVTITGNLTVQGASTYLTVASTNTYVNDPLIILNNAFASTNTYDIGLLINRGDQTSTALIWKEANKQFELIYTTENGTTYGAINNSGYANLKVGNLTVASVTTLSSLAVTGNINAWFGTFSGNVLIGGGALTANTTTFDLLNSTVSTLNFANAATAINIGAGTGTLTLNNATVTTPGQIIGTRAGSATTGDGQIFLNGTTSNRIDWAAVGTGAPAFTTRSDGTKVVFYPALSGSTVDYAIGVDSATLWSSVPENGDSFNFKWYGAETLVANLSGTGNFTTIGDVAVNGGDLTTTATTFNLLDATATTVNAFGAATAIDLGATSGTLTINNPTVVGTQSSQDLYNTTATTLNFAGAATTLIVGATTGVANIRNATTNIIGNATVSGTLAVTGDTTLTADLAVNGGDITTSAATFNLVDTTATTVNFAGAATAIDMGATTGTITINNPTLVGTQTTQAVYNTVATTVNAFGAATSLNVGASTGNTTVQNNLITTGNLNISATTESTNTTSGALVLLGGLGVAKNLNVGGNVVITGNLTVNGDVTTVNTATLDVEDLNITVAKGAVDSVSADGAGLTVDGAGATILYTHATTSWNLNKHLIGTSAQFSTTLGVTGDTTLTANLAVNGGSATTTATTFNLVNANATTLNLAGAATAINVGANSGTITIGNPTLVGTQSTQNVYDTVATTVNAFGAATTLIVGATTGVANIRNATTNIIGNATVGGDTTLTGDLAVNGGDLTTTAGTFNLLNTNATTVDAFKAATALTIGATSGTATLRNPTLVGTETTQNIYNTTATTVNAFGAATTLIMGATTGVANIRNATTNIIGNANILSTVDSIGYNSGALQVAGGVGVTGNIHIKSSKQLIVGADIPGAALSANTVAQFFSNVSNYNAVSHQNTSANALASSDFIAFADNGSDLDTNINFGIASSTYNNSNFNIIKANDGYLYTIGNSVTGGGNLLIGAVFNDVVFFTGGFDVSNEIARFNTTYGNLQLKQTQAAVSSTTGALTVAGGAGFAKNVYVAKGATINSTQSTENFIVKGAGSTALIYANSNTDSVVIGGGHVGGSGGNITIQPGVTLKIDSTDTVMLPVGSTAQRPSNSGNVDIKGMTRFNSTINNLEFYDGSAWQSAGSVFTVISDRQFSVATGNPYGNVDGINDTFTIQSSSTTSATIVSINGVIQVPALAYDVSTVTLTFTEPPTLGDVIDVRCLATTAVLQSLASGNGMSQFVAENTEAQIWTGASSTTKQFSIDTSGTATFEQNVLIKGKNIYDQTAIAVGTSAVVIDSFAKATYRSAKYVISVSNSGTGEYEASEVLVVHNGTTATRIQFGTIFTGSASLGSVTVAVNGTDVELSYTGVASGNAVKLSATYIKV